MSSAILLIHCPDKKGLITEVTQFLYDHNANVIDLDEHVDRVEGVFFMRVHFELNGFDLKKEEIAPTFDRLVGRKNEMNWQLHFLEKVPRMALFVTKSSHCLYDILARYQGGDWQVQIPLIISNHESLKTAADQFGIPFYHFHVTKENKEEVEAAQLRLMKEHQIDFVVLARYMQILSADFIKDYPNKIINIHHSFLPAFPGAKPYHQAHERGVKLIGATSHYVTSDLDAGPIIEQDVAKISHKDEVKDLIRKGQDLEKIVLSRAIRTHLLRKTLVYGNKTVVFD
uniref:formyltetrahydrofolate deformylase n=1 Tax=Mariniflexile sp. TaxID=1979402 RepID=UPI0040482C6B